MVLDRPEHLEDHPDQGLVSRVRPRTGVALIIVDQEGLGSALPVVKMMKKTIKKNKSEYETMILIY